MSPELLDRKPYTSSCDVWALGIILYHMCTGEFPEMTKIFQGQLAPVAGYSQDLQDLIHACLALKPEQRPVIKDIYKTQLIRQYIQEKSKKSKGAANCSHCQEKD